MSYIISGNLKKFITAFSVIAVIFVVTLAVVTCYRGGKDLRVGLFGVEQVLHKQSPYDNPTDINRPIYRYAPAYSILQRPFLLISRMTAPFEFDRMVPSILAWYIAEILALVISALLLFKLIPAPSREIGLRNLLISFLLAMPLIAYELVNSQNKIIALAFMIASIYLFEKKKNLLSAILFNLAMVIYIPLVFFIIYFALRGKVRFMLTFIAAFLFVFIIIPSLVWGYTFNNFLLRDWFLRCLKPFFMTSSYATYIELRFSSQTLPSTIGRMLVSGNADNYKYMISPSLIHIIVKVFSAIIMAVSVLSVWKRQKPAVTGLQYSILLTLPLILPSYCLWYTWSWLFVIYFVVLNYISHPDVPKGEKKILLIAAMILLIGSYSSAIKFFNIISVLFWMTLIFWAATAGVLIKRSYSKIC